MSWFTLVLSVTVLCGGMAQSARAQSTLTDAAQTPAQAAVANVILPAPGRGLCPELVGLQNAGTIVGGSRQEDLLARCRELVAGSNPASDVDLGDVNNGLQGMAPEEAATQGTNTVEMSNNQFANISARLAALRGSAASPTLRRYSDFFREPSAIGPLVASLDKTDTTGANTKKPGLFSSGRLGFFANGIHSSGDKDATSRESGFDFDIIGVTAGVDYRLSKQFILGLALGYMSTDIDLDSDGGGLDSDAYSVSLYGTYYVSDAFYIDSIASAGWTDNDVARTIRYNIRELTPDGVPTGAMVNVNQTASGDFDGRWVAFSIGTGYDFNFDALTIGPLIRFNYIHVDLDRYEEQISGTGAGSGLALTVDDQDIVSITLVLGGQASYAISTPVGILLPYVRLEWEHEFEDDRRTITASFSEDPTPDIATKIRLQTDGPDRDFFNVAGGLSFTLRGGLAAFFEYERVLGLDDVRANNFAFGVRIEF